MDGARVILLLAMLLTLSPCCSVGFHSPVECCFGYRKLQLPVAYLMDFYRTSTDCFMPAVVFETKNRTKICTNPENSWVKKAIQNLQKRKRSHDLVKRPSAL
ncbi:PREDICTED: C-C motif chemokine 4-like [Chlamydotis macqueenii]|uniref:C-C motif chemokine 4-like n=1 Tax=Chlamydotis macqueenii TaxID=187382 RepID=UPI000529895A|nr:PREDICTED: C-C motif chemokine 4-like [Chlamydotis macqueenii]